MRNCKPRVRIRDGEEEVEGFPHKAPRACISTRGPSGKACTMSWSSLPDDMVRHVFGKLSLIEFARITTTCSSFRAFYHDKRAREQEARHQLAVHWFGSKRIACLSALLVRLLRGEPSRPAFIYGKWKWCRISADGVLQFSWPRPPTSRKDIVVRIAEGGPWALVVVEAYAWSPRYLRVEIDHQWKGAVIDVRDDKDLKAVVLLQALLSEGLAGSILDVRYQAELHVGRWDEQIATLLPFARQHPATIG